MASSKGLLSTRKSMAQLKDLAARNVFIRIMAPITSENLNAMQQLSQCCEVRHVPKSALGTTIIDGKHLFQFTNTPPEQQQPEETSYFENAFYTNDSARVDRMEGMLDDIWKSASVPSASTLESILKPSSAIGGPQEADNAAAEIIKKKDQAKLAAKSGFGGHVTIGQALVHPPSCLNLPDMMIWVQKSTSESDFGASDTIIFALCLPTPTVSGYTFIPVAIVNNSPRSAMMLKTLFTGSPAAQNVIVIKPEQLEVWKQGNNLFAGWTVPISLLPPKYTLPPSCILFEGIGKPKNQTQTMAFPSGYTATAEYSGLEAFVTFINPSSKYTGPGTDGSLGMDVVSTTTPP
jgi:hypothetical protein